MAKNNPTPSGNRRQQLREQQLAEQRRQRANRITIIAAVVIALAILITVVTVFVQRNIEKENQQNLVGQNQIVPPSANKDHTAILYNTKLTEGVPNVRVFMDFQCPGCGSGEKTWVPLLKQLADEKKINLEFEMLHGLDSAFPGNHSQRAAIAATCADTVGKYNEYAFTVFSHQPAKEGDGWTDDQLIGWGKEAGMDADQEAKFTKCFTDRQTSEFVTNMQAAMPDTVHQTPSIFSNGKEVQFSNMKELSTAEMLRVIQETK